MVLEKGIAGWEVELEVEGSDDMIGELEVEVEANRDEEIGGVEVSGFGGKPWAWREGELELEVGEEGEGADSPEGHLEL